MKMSSADIEETLAAKGWAERNGLDLIGWDADAIAPPHGDVYEREGVASQELKAWALVAFGAALVFAAIYWLHL